MSVISKKLLNNIDDTVEECLKGFSYLYPQLILHGKHRVVSAPPNKSSKRKAVALISGGGSGHEPFATGYVGKGMLDGAVAGSIFASPPPTNVFYAIKYLSDCYPGGVFVMIPNYTGDRLNFGMAIEKARGMGIQVESIILGDDLASVNTGTGSRGMCGMSAVYKMIGALSEKGANLKEVQQTTIEILENMSTFGASLSACSLPGQPPLFHVDHDKLELGIGVHGEAGVSSMKMCSSKELVDILLKGLREKLKLSAGSEVALFINNLGAVSYLEINIVCFDAVSNLKSHGIKVKRVYAGPLMTSMDMVGAQLCLLKLPPNKSEEWLQLLDAETEAPGWVGSPVTIPQDDEARESFEDETVEVQMVTGPKMSSDETHLFKKCLTLCADALKSSEEILNRLDSGCGDGDCGATMKILALGIHAYISQNDVSYPARVFADLSDMGMAMGGTSGAIYSLGFSAASNVLASTRSVDKSIWLEALTNAVTSIAKYGGAKKGDRSLMDTLIPAVEAFKKHHASDASKVLKEIVKAAEIGCDATASMRARVGRASYVSTERASDRDAGALAVLCWLKALEQAFTN